MFETIVRYKSTNEKSIIVDHKDKWDSVLISAHLLAHATKRMPPRLRNIAQDRSHQYYIDPIVSEFRIGESFRYPHGGIRSWHRKYAVALGDPFETVLEREGNVNARYLDDDEIRGIAKSVVDFQEEFVYEKLEEYTGKYEDLTVSRREVMPAAVIPWVHKLEREADYEAYRTILSASQDRAMQSLRPVLYTSTRKIRDGGNRTELVEMLADFDIDECFILFEGLDKHETNESEYKAVIDFVYDLSSAGIEPYFYYGDFFSNLLSYFGLEGTAYSPLHGEKFTEKTEPQSSDSSGMSSRYYLDEVKDFLQIQAAVDIMTRAGKPMCSCEACSRHFDDWRDLAEIDESDEEGTALQTVVMKHRMKTRWDHAQLVQDNELSEVLATLRDDYDEMVGPYTRSQQTASRKEFDYLQQWIHAVDDRQPLIS